jgi:hypothetical protein
MATPLGWIPFVLDFCDCQMDENENEAEEERARCWT